METVLITGASGGIGAAIAKAFYEAGYRVILHYCRNEDSVLSLQKELPGSVIVRADLSDRSQVNRLANSFSDVDILINNAGIDLFSLFDLVSEEQESLLYQVNLMAPISLSRKLLKGMLSRKHGSIINISSYFGEIGASCEVDYSVTKAAMIGFTKALAKEVGPAGIRVNCICPGVVDTPMNDRLTFEEVADLTEQIPLERLGIPNEIAQAALFLASDNASYITGAVLDINGGII